MQIAGGPETYFRVLAEQGIRDVIPFRSLDKPAAPSQAVPLAGGAMAVGGAAALAKERLDRKKIKKIVKQEIEKERKSHTGPGLNGISFF
jgi:glycerol-3-phosphate dehydrogenase